MSEDFKSYAQLHAELATLKAERDELRSCLKGYMDYFGAPPTDSMSYDSIGEELWRTASAILSKT